VTHVPHNNYVRFVFDSGWLCGVGARVSYLRFLCLFAYSGANTYCVVFLFFLILCDLYVFPVSLDCPFLISPSIFSNVYVGDLVIRL
jgi:hypothetical protein